MAVAENPKFSFVSKALTKDTFSVVRFEGQEGLSLLYRFEVILVSREDQLDLEAILAEGCTFTIHAQQDDIPVHGILEALEQRQKVDEYTFYRAVLRPKLWWLTLTQHNQIFLDKSFPQFLEAVLKDAGLVKDIDFELKLSGNYPEWEYICQYNESYFDFISHWMERYGVYYYFEQSSETDKVIFTDTSMAHVPMPQGQSFSYYQPSGLEATHSEELINSFVCSQRSLPQAVRLKDYNYEHPDMSLEAEAQITSKGRGVLYSYEEHFRSLAEGNELAKIRAEEQLCRQRLFMGESTVPCIRPGYTFDLKRHYREDFNGSYLSIEARHEGNQEAYLRSGLGLSLQSSAESVDYRNSFTVIPSGVQFRPERVTQKSRFHGTMTAKIDAAGSGKYAELDDQGRYKVILPFDRSGRGDGKASCWLRMMQPYSGPDHGMHFPLHKGCEVVLNFIDGNPDRPIIAGAAPNPDNPSQVTDENQTMSKIKTAGGNQLHMEDKEGSQRMLMQTPTANTWMRLGTPNDPPHESSDEEDSEEGSSLFSLGLIKVEGAKMFEIIKYHKGEMVLGAHEKMVLGNSFDLKAVNAIDIRLAMLESLELGPKFNFGPEDTEMRAIKNKLHTQKAELAEVQETMVQECEELKAQTNLLAENCNRLVQENNNLAQANSKLTQANEELTQQNSRLSQENEELSQSVQKISEMETTLAQMQDGMAEQWSYIFQNETTISETKEELASNSTALATSIEEIAGDKITV
ncbi:MAG: type VI secretion system tip protein TssI/VgrG [Thermodesulfobacteriota bacterium]